MTGSIDPTMSAAHARLREALARHPGWRSLPPQHVPSTGEWRASAHDARHGRTGRVTATGGTAEEAVGRLAAELQAMADGTDPG